MRKILLLAVLTATFIPAAFAGHLVLTLNNPVLTGVPGDNLIYTGYVTYSSDNIDNDPGLFVSGESINSPSENLTVLSGALGVLDYLTPGSRSSDFYLTLTIDPLFGTNGTDVFGMNPFDYTLYGGLAFGDFDPLIDGTLDGAQAFFANIVDPNAPPPDPGSDPPPVDPPLTDPNAPPTADTPEPGTWALLGGGLGAVIWKRRLGLTAQGR